MYAQIKTNGATDILIKIPSETSVDTMQALTNMLENNCVFARADWSETKVVEPDMKIVLASQAKRRAATDTMLYWDKTKKRLFWY